MAPAVAAAAVATGPGGAAGGGGENGGAGRSLSLQVNPGLRHFSSVREPQDIDLLLGDTYILAQDSLESLAEHVPAAAALVHGSTIHISAFPRAFAVTPDLAPRLPVPERVCRRVLFGSLSSDHDDMRACSPCKAACDAVGATTGLQSVVASRSPAVGLGAGVVAAASRASGATGVDAAASVTLVLKAVKTAKPSAEDAVDASGSMTEGGGAGRSLSVIATRSETTVKLEAPTTASFGDIRKFVARLLGLPPAEVALLWQYDLITDDATPAALGMASGEIVAAMRRLSRHAAPRPPAPAQLRSSELGSAATLGTAEPLHAGGETAMEDLSQSLRMFAGATQPAVRFEAAVADASTRGALYGDCPPFVACFCDHCSSVSGTSPSRAGAAAPNDPFWRLSAKDGRNAAGGRCTCSHCSYQLQSPAAAGTGRQDVRTFRLGAACDCAACVRAFLQRAAARRLAAQPLIQVAIQGPGGDPQTFSYSLRPSDRLLHAVRDAATAWLLPLHPAQRLSLAWNGSPVNFFDESPASLLLRDGDMLKLTASAV